MAQRLSGSTACVWLTVLKAGGRLTSAEVVKAAGDGVDAPSVRSLLNSLTTTGSVRKYEQAGSLMRYGVTAACKVPQGVTIGDILAATQLQDVPA